jgi:hypothetical protein
MDTYPSHSQNSNHYCFAQGTSFQRAECDIVRARLDRMVFAHKLGTYPACEVQFVELHQVARLARTINVTAVTA